MYFECLQRYHIKAKVSGNYELELLPNRPLVTSQWSAEREGLFESCSSYLTVLEYGAQVERRVGISAPDISLIRDATIYVVLGLEYRK